MSGSLRHNHGRPIGAPFSGGVSRSLVLLAVVFAFVAAACSTLSASAESTEAAEDCFLGLDLWDTDPALTWIEDGKVWVRAGDHQACLDDTDATELWWGPDGRRLLLDDRLFEAGAATPAAIVPRAQQIVWRQPFGDTIHAVDVDGGVVQVVGDQSIQVANPVALIASHPDGEHLAAVDGNGRVILSPSYGGAEVALMRLSAAESVTQMEFAADGSRLWLLTTTGSDSQVRYVDLLPISDKLAIEPVESIVPGMSVPVPELYFIDPSRNELLPTLEVGVGATGVDITRFVLHPAHPDWVAVTEGRCAAAVSSLYLDGEVSAAELPGAVVGFFRGGGMPILATTTSGGECGTGPLWVVDGLPDSATATLVAEDVTAADIRDEAPDPWNPNTAPPFA